MAAKILKRMKARPAPKPDQSEHEAALKRIEAKAAADRTALEARLAKLDGERKAAEKRAAEVARERDEALLASTVSQEFTRVRAINPAHGVKLTRDAFEVVEGKVVVKGAPDKTVAAFIDEYTAGEGKYLLPSVVPSGGTGAPPSPNAPKAATPHDLTTRAGMTEYARSLTVRADQARTPSPAPRGGAGGEPPTGLHDRHTQ